jgi:hypothetical protein
MRVTAAGSKAPGTLVLASDADFTAHGGDTLESWVQGPSFVWTDGAAEFGGGVFGPDDAAYLAEIAAGTASDAIVPKHSVVLRHAGPYGTQLTVGSSGLSQTVTPTPDGVEAVFALEMDETTSLVPVFTVDGGGVFEDASVEGAEVTVATAVPTIAFAGISTGQNVGTDLVFDMTFAGPTSGEVKFIFPAGLKVKNATGADKSESTLTLAFAAKAQVEHTFNVTAAAVGAYKVDVEVTGEAIDGVVEKNATVTILDTTGPSAVSNLRASTPGNDATPTIAWDAATDNVGVVDYVVTRSGTQLGVVTSPGYTFTSGLAQGQHTVTVRARDAAGNLGGTASTTFTIDVTAPEISDFVLKGAGTQRIIEWKTNEDTSSKVLYGVSKPPSQTVEAGEGKSFSVNLTGLQANTTYYYALKSTDAAGNTADKVGVLLVGGPAGGTLDLEIVRTPAPQDLVDAMTQIAPGLTGSSVFLVDTDGDGKPDSMEAAGLSPVRQVGAKPLFLLESEAGELMLVDVDEGEANPVAELEGTITETQLDRAAKEGVATVTVEDKSGWIYVSAEDSFPDGEIDRIVRDDGYEIPADMVWRDGDGQVYYLDDPSTTYRIVYSVDAAGAFPWLMLVLGVLLLMTLLGAAGYAFLVRLRLGEPAGHGGATPVAAGPEETTDADAESDDLSWLTPADDETASAASSEWQESPQGASADAETSWDTEPSLDDEPGFDESSDDVVDAEPEPTGEDDWASPDDSDESRAAWGPADADGVDGPERDDGTA